MAVRLPVVPAGDRRSRSAIGLADAIANATAQIAEQIRKIVNGYDVLGVEELISI